jgi:hypothetical protein
MPPPTDRRLSLSPELEQRRIVTMQEAVELTTLSEDTLARNYPDLIIRLSPRRKGMRLGDVLTIAEGTDV